MFLKLLLRLTGLLFILALFSCSLQQEQDRTSSLEKFSQDYNELTQRYEELIRENPQNLALKVKLALFYYNFKDYKKARKLLENIDSPKAKEFLIKTLIRLKDYDYAIEAIEQLESLPEDSEFLYLYGQVLEEKNLFPKAIKIYNKVGTPYKTKAQARLEIIKTRQEQNVIPVLVSQLAEEATDFLSQLDDASAVLLADESIEITSNNTSITTVQVVEKVLQERGKELAEIDIGYDSTYERVELEFARTITADGKVVYAGRKDTRDVSRYLNFPLYSNSRAFIISMPSVDVGAIIEYKLKIYSSKLVDKDNFSFIYRLRESSPIFKAKLELIVPKDKEVKFKFFNQEYAEGINLEPNSEIKNKKVYSWYFNNIKSIIPEYSMPSDSLVNPAVLISSFSSWDQIYKWWKSLYLDKVESTDDIQELIKEVTKDSKSDLDRARKIYEYVAKNIRYVAIEYGDSGYEPHSAQEVLLNRYGDCKDQSILLVAMFKAAGLKAYPVLIPTRDTYSTDIDFPSLSFNHAICALDLEGQLIFMDPTSETTPFGEIPLSDQDRTVLVFLDDNWLITKTTQNKENKVLYTMDVNLDADENATIFRSVVSQGFFASGYRWYLKYTHPALIEEDIRAKMTSISPFSRLVDYNIENRDNFDSNPVLTYNFVSEKFLNPAKNLRIIPPLDQLGLDYNLISKEERDYPIDFEGFYAREAKVKVVLPDNLAVKYLPSSKVLDNPWFKLNISYADNPKSIDFSQELIIKKRFVDIKDYQEFKNYLKEAIYYLREEIILEKAGG
ncbi:MAG: DUF3857 domain-containing protein [Candidatus Omnitrophica bacterium]|jgi:transglutaminase-like putative cysteine protease/thioredoxin-like negative regulator of GroEL|nr:DUF3857 domain-containing protein [Candidatus Omnitrophota bacterium]